MPDKWKGGRIEKFVNYWKGVKMDYSEAFKGENKFIAVLTNNQTYICDS